MSWMIKSIKDEFETIEDLRVDNKDLSMCTEEHIDKFTNLKKLCVYANIENGEWKEFPKAFLSKNIEELRTTGIKWKEISSFKLKGLRADILASEFSDLINHFKDLEELELEIEGDLTIDNSILQLKKLKELKIKFKEDSYIKYEISDMSSLKELKRLELGNVLNNKFEKAWCTCANLEDLNLWGFPNFEEFPKEIENLKNLNKLYLGGFGSKTEKSSMPESFSLLKNLKILSTWHCNYEYVLPVAKLTKLEDISFSSSKLKSIPDLTDLKKLKELDLSNSKELSNIEGLKNVTTIEKLDLSTTKVNELLSLKKLINLKKLDIDEAEIDKQKIKLIEALVELECFDTLKELGSDSIYYDEWQERDKDKYIELVEKRKGLRNFTKEEIIEVCEDDDNLELFEEMCLTLLDLENTFEDEIEDLSEGGQSEIEYFDDALSKYVGKLKDETLIHLIDISLSEGSFRESYKLTDIVIEEAVARKSVQVQEAIAEAFVENQGGCDAGHRYRESTIQDELIDYWLGHFEEGPLSTVLLGTDKAALMVQYGDEVGMLFYDYFKEVTDKEMSIKVLGKYKSYIFEEIISCEYEEKKEEILDGMKSDKHSDLVKEELLEIIKIVDVINELLEEENIENFEKLLRELDKENNSYAFDTTEWSDLAEDLEEEIDELDYDLVYSVFLKCIQSKSRETQNKLFFFELLFILDVAKATKDLSQDIKDDQLIQNIYGKDTIYGTKMNDLYMFKMIVIGLINGVDEETTRKEIEAKIKK